MPGTRPTKRLLREILVSVAFGTLGCTSAAKAPQLIADETSGPLGNVVLLPLTTRSTDDLLGHAWSAETDFADPRRGVLNGTVMVTSTDQRITFFREATIRGEVDAELGVAATSGSVSNITHVLYDVHVTSLATLASASQRYNPESGCCLQGNPTDGCEAGYVHRLLRGSGTIRMLARLAGTASVGVRGLLMARGGAQYQVVDESTFNDAYFGLELTPLQSVCRTLTPEQEMAPLQLKAAPNCVIQRYSTLGEKETLSRQLPNEQLCDNVAERYCGELVTLLSCRVRFGDAEEVELAPKVEAAPAEPQVSKPATTGSGNRIKKK